jgi:hypothetical protein
MTKKEDGRSMPACNGEQREFHNLGKRAVVGKFDGGMLSSDGGGLLLGEVEARTRLVERFAAQFTDHRNPDAMAHSIRDPDAIEHSIRDLVGQRVFRLALVAEGRNDHDRLRLDPLLAVLVGKEDLTGQARSCPRDKGKPLAKNARLQRIRLPNS